ncbi:MAG TPA: FmdB family zinc ribbon protein [Actinomycetota bacterium]|jgi:putative FmdB family regulatory protein|nr:FmdB family zinc ribbon protein [Actinomycetota bacterium]
MPTYEYVCTECGDHTEVVRSFADAPLTTCTVCGGALRRVFSPVGIVFKGSGFYRTDSRGKSGKPAKTDGDKTKKPADATSSSSDSKAASSDGASSTSKPKAAEKSA